MDCEDFKRDAALVQAWMTVARGAFLLLVALAVLGTTAGLAVAQSQPPPSSPAPANSPPPAKVQQLIDLMGDPEVKKWLETRSPPAAAEDSGSSVAEQIASREARIRDHIASLKAALPRIPQELAQAGKGRPSEAFACFDRCDEAVTMLRHRFDETRIGGVVTELAPQHLDALGERLIGHRDAGPDLVHEAVFRHQPALFANHQCKSIELAAVELDRIGAARQPAIGGIEPELCEAKADMRHSGAGSRWRPDRSTNIPPLSAPLPLPFLALDGAPPASVHPGWGRKQSGASHQLV